MNALLNTHVTILEEVIEHLAFSFNHSDRDALVLCTAISCMQHRKKIDVKKCKKLHYAANGIEREFSIVS